MGALNFSLASLSSQFSAQRLRELNALNNNLNTGAGYLLAPLPLSGSTSYLSHASSVSGLLNLFNRNSPAWPLTITTLRGDLNGLARLEPSYVRQALGPVSFVFSLNSVYTRSLDSLVSNVRTKFTPSSLGFGLDEARLVRTGSSRLADSAIISNKLESLGAPSLSLPQTPLALLSLGWSTTASLATYPSYKLARGGLLRRPFTGISKGANPLEGLKEPFTPLNLSKTSAPFGYSNLTLFRPLVPQFKISSPSLDTQLGAWASVWAVSTPAPTEDLDPTFINTIWTPEINTTRRSDHNSRYLVSWSPLVSSLTTGVGFNPSLSGPAVRGAQAPALLRSSLLGLNELGLKNSIGLRGVQSRSVVNQDLNLESSLSHVLSVTPSIAFDTPTLT